MQNFRALGASPPDPRASGGWGFCPQTPQTAPPIANFWLRACTPMQHALGKVSNALYFKNFKLIFLLLFIVLSKWLMLRKAITEN